jgi:hypothetical protein
MAAPPESTFRAPPPELAAWWERRLARYRHLLDPAALDRSVGRPVRVEEQAGAYYRQAPELARKFGKKFGLDRAERRIIARYVEGLSIADIVRRFNCRKWRVALIVDRFEVFCRTRGVSIAMPRRKRKAVR